MRSARRDVVARCTTAGPRHAGGTRGTLTRAAHDLFPQTEAQAGQTARARYAGRRLSELLRDSTLTRFAPRQGRLSLIPLLRPQNARETRVRFPPPPYLTVRKPSRGAEYDRPGWYSSPP
jgi:hypothetical protein